MSQRIKQTGTTLRKVRNIGRTLPKVDATLVAERLGAQQSLTPEVEHRGGMPALLALRQELARRLISTGGRPGLAGTERRQKIPLADADWEALEELARGISDEQLNPTPGQVASVLLHNALQEILRKTKQV